MSFEINKRITMYRKLLNLSQKTVAELMDMKSSTYSQMERGGSVTCDRLIRLSEIFGISPILLLCGNEQNDISNPEGNTLLREGTFFERDKFNSNPPIVLSKKEENYIKILRNLSKQDRDEVIEFLEQKYKESK